MHLCSTTIMTKLKIKTICSHACTLSVSTTQSRVIKSPQDLKPNSGGWGPLALNQTNT